jgi:NAD(P)-dependent dehydrogenase (short-subunit alcohol dehydrogenase family)
MSSTLFDLSGRTALVTAGSKGLGKAMARALAKAGASVSISSNDDELRSTAAEIAQESHAKVVPLAAEMTHRGEVQRLAKRAIAAFGKVDILINNAGGNTPQPIDQITDEVWDHFVELNLSSCMALTRALVPQMKDRKWGRVIHISSIFAFTSIPERSVYSATKSALLGLARASALDLGPFGITVNCIAPGPFLTELTLRNFTVELAQMIANSALFIGNQSCPNSIAEGLKHDSILEVSLESPDCIYRRANAIHCYNGELEFEAPQGFERGGSESAGHLCGSQRRAPAQFRCGMDRARGIRSNQDHQGSGQGCAQA